METRAPDPTQLGFHDTEQSITPPELKRVLPLRIVKRSDNACGDDADDRPCRRCSQATTESRDSAPESIEGERQLTVPKVRGSRTSQVFSSLGDVDETPVPLGREAYLRNGWSLRSYRDAYSLTEWQAMRHMIISSSAQDRDCHQINTTMSTQKTCNQLAPALHAGCQSSGGKASPGLLLGFGINSPFSALAMVYHRRTVPSLVSWATSCRDRELRTTCPAVTQTTRSLLIRSVASRALFLLPCLM